MPTETITTKVFSTSPTAGVDVSETTTTQVFPLGMEVTCSDGNTYQYCKANEAIAAFAACLHVEDGGLLQLTTTNATSQPGIVLVAQRAIANGAYGWAVKRGNSFSVLTAASALLDVRMYTTATAGVVDDAATELIQGLRLNATNGGSQAAVNASAPAGMSVNASAPAGMSVNAET